MTADYENGNISNLKIDSEALRNFVDHEINKLVESKKEEAPAEESDPDGFRNVILNNLTENQRIVYLADHEMIINEYELIQNKKSVLSRSMRDSVVSRYNHLIKTGKINNL